MRPSVVNLTFHKTLFQKIGGYDEDYAGHYGREHTDFFERMQRAGKLIATAEITIRLMPHWMIADAKTATGERNDYRNTELFLAKRKAGFPVQAPGLRFAWTQQA